MKISQDFNRNGQSALAEINTKVKNHLDAAKALEKQAQEAEARGDTAEAEKLTAKAKDERQSADNWQHAGVGLNMLISGLSAPTESVAGIATATLAPAASYEIGQKFKGLAKENADGKLSEQQKAAHVLAHAVLGAAVAATGGNDAIAGALSAGGAEAIAPVVSQFMYGTDDPEKLTAEQKETIASISSLAGAATGAIVGNSTANAVLGGLNAENAVENNKLNFSSTDTVSRQLPRPTHEQTAFETMLKSIMPAHMAMVSKDTQERDALLMIADLRNNFTGPITIVAATAPYAITASGKAVALTPQAVQSLTNLCLSSPVGCNNAGIVIAETISGVSMMPNLSLSKPLTQRSFSNISTSSQLNLGAFKGKLNTHITDEQLKEAQKLLDNSIATFNALNLKPATIIGAVDPISGKVVVMPSGDIPEKIAPALLEYANKLGGLGVKTACGNVLGRCAEFRAANELMLNNNLLRIEDIHWTQAVRPRTGTKVKRCDNCTNIFGVEKQ